MVEEESAMEKLIVYGSQYGTAKQYAERFSEMTGIPVRDYKGVKDLKPYDLILYFGGLYAGNVKGLKYTAKALREGTKLIVVTVGLADPQDERNAENILNSVRKQVPERLLPGMAVFHLRGGIYHLKKLPEEKKTEETKAMIETYNSEVNFVDYHSLDQIAEVTQI